MRSDPGLVFLESWIQVLFFPQGSGQSYPGSAVLRISVVVLPLEAT